MSTFVTSRPHPRPRPEADIPQELLRPSGEPYHRPVGALSIEDDVSSTISAIDGVLVEDGASAPSSSSHTPEERASEAWIREEKYALSFRRMERFVERVGAAALTGEVETEEGIRLRETLKDEWKSSLIEMLATDPDFRRGLYIKRIRSYDIVGGRVMVEGPDGPEPMVDMVGRGVVRSELAAREDDRMSFQAQRDRADLRNVEEVDKLAPGTLRVVVSMDPKDAFKGYDRKFVESLGYREGWGSMQGYFKLPDGKGLQTLTFTFNHSNLAVMRKILNARGAGMPETVTADSFIEYGINVPCETVEQASDFLDALCKDSYKMQGLSSPQNEVGEFLEANPIVEQVFNLQYIPLAVAHHSGIKSSALHAFAEEMYKDVQGLNPEARERLANICCKPTFDRGDTEIIDYLMRYGLVELLRKQLPALLQGEGASGGVANFVTPSHIPPEVFIARNLASNAKVGIAAGRTYGGCTAAIDILGKSDTPGIPSPQDAFGGKDEPGDKSKWVWKKGVCRIENCPTRPRSTEIGPCEVCRKCQSKYDSGQDPALLYAKLGTFKGKQNRKASVVMKFKKSGKREENNL